MLGGTYLTNLPEGEATLRITPGGARADIVEKVVIKAGELQKISVPIGAETHVRLPGIPAPEGYVVTFTNGDDTVAYDPNGEVMLSKGKFTTFLSSMAINNMSSRRISMHFPQSLTEVSVRDSFETIALNYQVRNPNGSLLSEGLV